MELREIEVFLTLAEELHFGRTAARLFISPARVSQVIKAQERLVGALLFERNSRTVRLTAIGQQLYEDLRPHYVGLHDSFEHARRAARGVTGRLQVGMMPLNFFGLWHYWKTFRKRYPQWELQIRHVDFTKPFAQLRRGDFDVFVAWLPVEEPDLTVGPMLLDDPRVLAVADDHPVANRSSIGIEMLADFPQPLSQLELDYWENGFVPLQTPRGRTIERVGMYSNDDDLIDAIAMGDISVAFPSHVTEFWSMPRIRYLPIPDLAPLRFVLVWRTETENDMIRALAEVVRSVGTLRMRE
ncbi:LysR family transcriptional regulator [Nocardia stercoris]|uniref:LysR family transcriptional regulator n=1 Tax=Nocardia stercoris TaxID=2483361 RepID=A0A3M2LDJ4_9NOCA|nr:LysR family transcriptional regulator [Nocardia stercoris]RMI32768.1 LysR family transcriptional regulator [Nocardia stercoris]